MSRGTKIWLGLAVVLTLVAMAWVWGELWPLGVTGEWVWNYGKSSHYDRILFALVPAATLAWVCWGMRGAVMGLRGARGVAFLAVVVMLTFWLQVAYVYMGSVAFGQATFWMGTPKLNMAFDEASKMTSVRRLFREAQRPDETPQHSMRRRLPGAVLFYHAQFRFWREAPVMAGWFANRMEEVLPYAREAREDLEERTVMREFHAVERATMYGAMVLLWLAVALGVVPLYYWANDVFGHSAATVAVGLYGLMPSFAVFNPVTDLLNVPLALALVALFHWGAEYRKPVVLVVAGMGTWLAVQFTLAFVVIVFMAGVELVLSLAYGRRELAALKNTVWIVAGFCVLLGLAWWWLGYNSFRVWALSVGSGADFIQATERSYFLWLWCNPLDFALFMGAPVAVFMVRGCMAMRDSWISESMWRFMMAFLVTLMVLILSGINRGEAARLWMFLMPLATAIAAYGIEDVSDDGVPVYLVSWGMLFCQTVVFRMSLDVLLPGAGI